MRSWRLGDLLTAHSEWPREEMTDSQPDDANLRATEAQMRQALGLRGDARIRPVSDQPATLTSGTQPQRRRFVRDGEVPVTVVHRNYQADGGPGNNQLDVARQAIRAEAAARERAEKSLNEAHITIRDLQTKVAHERLAKDEAQEIIRRLETETRAAVKAVQSAEAELAAVRLARQNAEDALAEALEARQETEGRLRAIIAAQQAQTPTTEPPNGHGRPKATDIKPKTPAARDIDQEPHAKTALSPTIVDDGSRLEQTRRRGRPAKVRKQESEFVEWWKPGWRDKFR
jgi:hypothetical protein